MGSAWVPLLLHRLDHVGHLGHLGRRAIPSFGGALTRRPSEIFLEHIWVSPFPEEDVPALVDVIGPERVLMGSDFPHGEGTPKPADYAASLSGLDAATVRRIMRDNALELICGTAA
ncbi:MAG TPA: amidohydrolase family protein, partial [Acidimicrobiales bacterium]|nr:amidohydrolase family protein [Acidimicrobiales bacterium]